MEEVPKEVAKALVGMPVEKAKELYGLSGWIIRCRVKDGKHMLGTCDLLPNRINVETAGGIITKVIGHG